MPDRTGLRRGPFCPLYREAIQFGSWQNPHSAHAGLLFDKFADGWWDDSEWGFAFDKGSRSRDDRGNESDEKENWLTKPFQNRYRPDSGLLAEACRRQREMIARLGGKVVVVSNSDRFVTGLGREHPLENGFVWHHTLGVPYLPGSSLKGMLRAWMRETYGMIGEDKSGNSIYKETANIEAVFGIAGLAGQIILFDMLPTKPPKLSVDVMTPHYAPYYQHGEVPGDWHSPVPITFLTVAPEQSWQIGVAFGSQAGKVHDAPSIDQLVVDLLQAIEVNGVGAKTAVGYGRFQIDHSEQQRLEKEDAKRRAMQEEAKRRAEEEEQFQASLAGDSEPLQQLKKLQRDKSWQLSTPDTRMLDALEAFCQTHPEPPQDCLDWIRNLLESIPKYKGVWEAPDATTGKAKNPKPKYSSGRVRELVKRLNPKFRK